MHFLPDVDPNCLYWVSKGITMYLSFYNQGLDFVQFWKRLLLHSCGFVQDLIAGHLVHTFFGGWSKFQLGRDTLQSIHIFVVVLEELKKKKQNTVLWFICWLFGRSLISNLYDVRSVLASFTFCLSSVIFWTLVGVINYLLIGNITDFRLQATYCFFQLQYYGFNVAHFLNKCCIVCCVIFAHFQVIFQRILTAN